MRMIDADALMKTVFNDVVLVDGEVKGVGLILAETVDKAHTIDAVPVVRCRECKHGELVFLSDNGTTHIECYKCIHPTIGLKIMEPDDFCSYGERRTEKKVVTDGIQTISRF